MEKLNTIFWKIVKIVNRTGSVLVFCLVLFFMLDIHTFDDFMLRLSAGSGYTGAVKVLLYFGANVHGAEDQALQLASQEGHFEIVKSLLDHGANIHASDDVALYVALKNGHEDIVKLLLDRANFAPSACIRNFWMRTAEAAGQTEILNLIRERTKPTAASCSATNYAP